MIDLKVIEDKLHLLAHDERLLIETMSLVLLRTIAVLQKPFGKNHANQNSPTLTL